MHFVFLLIIHFISSDFIFLINEIFNSFHLRIIHFLDRKQYVGAGINTLLSISDGLGPSIFFRKMERERPMREDMVEKVVYFPPESAF